MSKLMQHSSKPCGVSASDGKMKGVSPVGEVDMRCQPRQVSLIILLNPDCQTEDRRMEDPGGAEVTRGYRMLSTKTGGTGNRISGRRNQIGRGFGRMQSPQGVKGEHDYLVGRDKTQKTEDRS